jgi:hypothetical protein
VILYTQNFTHRTVHTVKLYTHNCTHRTVFTHCGHNCTHILIVSTASCSRQLLQIAVVPTPSRPIPLPVQKPHLTDGQVPHCVCVSTQEHTFNLHHNIPSQSLPLCVCVCVDSKAHFQPTPQHPITVSTSEPQSPIPALIPEPHTFQSQRPSPQGLARCQGPVLCLPAHPCVSPPELHHSASPPVAAHTRVHCFCVCACIMCACVRVCALWLRVIKIMRVCVCAQVCIRERTQQCV